MTNKFFEVKKIVLVVMVISIFSGNTIFSEPKNEALKYMNKHTKEIDTIQIKIWDYVKHSAHSTNIAQVENKRKTLLTAIMKSVNSVNKIEPYNGDKILKKAVLKYLYTLQFVLKEDYSKIANMEELAEESYDMMEAFIVAKGKAKKKLNDAADELIQKQMIYAKKNNINIIFKDSKISNSLKKAGKVMNYFNSIYLIFFKSNKQELHLLEALNKSDLNKIEQNRLALIKDSMNGLKKLTPIKNFENDSSLKESCRTLLNFYNSEASKKMLVMTNFLLKKEQFKNFKKAFDLKEEKERTQSDIDLYNSKIKEMNEAVKNYNNMNRALNNKRRELIRSWNEICKVFFDTHVPH